MTTPMRMKTRILLTFLFTGILFSNNFWADEAAYTVVHAPINVEPTKTKHATVRDRVIQAFNVSRSRQTKKEIVKNYARWYAKEKYGYTDRQFAKVAAIWEQESHWNWLAHNEQTGAWGIAQMQMKTKVKSPFRQAELGLKYIEHRYGGPDQAYRHKLKTGTY